MDENTKVGKASDAPAKWPEVDVADEDKLGLDVNVVQIVDDVVSSLGKIMDAVHNLQDKKYAPALAAILAVIQQLFVNEVLPRIKTASKPTHP